MIYFLNEPHVKKGRYLDISSITEEEWKHFWEYLYLINENKAFEDIWVGKDQLARWWFSDECVKIAEEYNQLMGE